MKSLVSSKDYPKLIHILSKIENHTLYKDVSILILRGLDTTILMQLISYVSQSCFILNKYDKDIWEARHRHVMIINSGENINDFHRYCNDGIYKTGFNEELIRIVPRLVLYTSKTIPDIEVKDEDKRRPMFLSNHEIRLRDLHTEFICTKWAIQLCAYWKFICKYSPIFSKLPKDLYRYILSTLLLFIFK